MDRRSLKDIDPRLWLMIALGLITVLFSIVKAIQATGLRTDASDRPAPAFAPAPLRLISEETFLDRPRLPDDLYRRLSMRSAKIGLLGVRGGLTAARLTAEGMPAADAKVTARLFGEVARRIRGVEIKPKDPYLIRDKTDTQIAIEGRLLLLNPQSGEPPRVGVVTLIFRSSDGFAHARLDSLGFRFG